MDYQQIIALVQSDMNQVDNLINDQLKSDVALINQIGQYIISGIGKRIRPCLLVLSARSCGYDIDQEHIKLAAIIEFIHTATLLHDDVIDGSQLRRNKKTANRVFGNSASVLVGDFLYSRASQLMVQTNNLTIISILSDAINTITEGEVMQLVNCQNFDAKEHDYLKIIYRKTAKLFEATARLGAVITQQLPAIEQALQAYGRHLGIAFQLIDDALDYEANTAIIGKNVGDDLAEGKPTLPLIYLIANGSEQQRQMVQQIILNGGSDNKEQLTSIISAMKQTGALQYTRELAQQEIKQAVAALQPLPDSKYKSALINLAKITA